MSQFNETRQSFASSKFSPDKIQADLLQPTTSSQINLGDLRETNKGPNTSMGTRDNENKLKVNPFRVRNTASRENDMG